MIHITYVQAYTLFAKPMDDPHDGATSQLEIKFCMKTLSQSIATAVIVSFTEHKMHSDLVPTFLVNCNYAWALQQSPLNGREDVRSSKEFKCIVELTEGLKEYHKPLFYSSQELVLWWKWLSLPSDTATAKSDPTTVQLLVWKDYCLVKIQVIIQVHP